MMEVYLEPSQTREIRGPVYKIMINCHAGRINSLQIDGLPPFVQFVGKRTFIAPPGQPYSIVRIVTSSGTASKGIAVWYTTTENEELPIVEAVVDFNGGALSTPKPCSSANCISADVGAALAVILPNATVPQKALRAFIQNLGPSDIEIGPEGFTFGNGIIVPNSGGSVTVNTRSQISAQTIDATVQVSPANTRIWIEEA